MQHSMEMGVVWAPSAALLRWSCGPGCACVTDQFSAHDWFCDAVHVQDVMRTLTVSKLVIVAVIMTLQLCLAQDVAQGKPTPFANQSSNQSWQTPLVVEKVHACCGEQDQEHELVVKQNSTAMSGGGLLVAGSNLMLEAWEDHLLSRICKACDSRSLKQSVCVLLRVQLLMCQPAIPLRKAARQHQHRCHQPLQQQAQLQLKSCPRSLPWKALSSLQWLYHCHHATLQPSRPRAAAWLQLLPPLQPTTLQ